MLYATKDLLVCALILTSERDVNIIRNRIFCKNFPKTVLFKAWRFKM